MKLGKQYQIGKWWGTFKLLTNHVLPYLSIVNSLGILTTLWILTTDTTIWYFVVAILGLVVAVAALYLLEYMFGMPSYFKVINSQSWIHENPQRELMERIEKEIKELKTEIRLNAIKEDRWKYP